MQMSGLSCCTYSELASNADPCGITSARGDVVDAMRHLGDVKFDGPSEVTRNVSDREERCVENKAKLAKAITSLIQLTQKLENIIRQAALYNAPRETLYGWIDEITKLWDRLSALHQAFTWLERSSNPDEGRVAVRQIRWSMASINEQIGKCNMKREQCIASIACNEHEGGLPLFGTYRFHRER